MATQAIMIELPEALAVRLKESGLLQDTVHLEQVLDAYQAQQHLYSQAEMLAAVEEMYGMCADSDWTMDDVLAMKREEAAIEEQKLNQLESPRRRKSIICEG